MAEGGKDDNMTMYLIIGVIILAAGYMLMKKKNGMGFMNASGKPSLDEIITMQREGKGFSPDIAYEPIDPTEATKPGSLSAWPNPEKSGIPIISGSIDSANPKEFDVGAAGACQCDDRQCCYYAPFYAKTGEKRNYAAPRKCTQIFWGDTVEACEKVYDEYVRENERFNSARAAVSYYAYHPSAAYQATRLQKARYARAMG